MATAVVAFITVGSTTWASLVGGRAAASTSMADLVAPSIATVCPLFPKRHGTTRRRITTRCRGTSDVFLAEPHGLFRTDPAQDSWTQVDTLPGGLRGQAPPRRLNRFRTSSSPWCPASCHGDALITSAIATSPRRAIRVHASGCCAINPGDPAGVWGGWLARGSKMAIISPNFTHLHIATLSAGV